jgi:hypothetical protein
VVALGSKEKQNIKNGIRHSDRIMPGTAAEIDNAKKRSFLIEKIQPGFANT